MIWKTSSSEFLLTMFMIISLSITASAQEAQDLVSGNLIQFNDNGAWCWYQDERTVVDVVGGKLIIGSDASGNGVGGSSRNGRIEGVIFNLQNASLQRFTFMNAGCDDHNAPAFLIRPDGQYLTMYAQHYDNYSRYRIYNGSSWTAEQRFNWNTIPGGSNFSTTYSNLFYLSAEDKVYNIARADQRSPNIIISDDYGDSWSYVGYLTEPDESIGYVNGYFKYWSNSIDRIDFVCTEHHPRDYNTSIYHGYIKNGQTFDSHGTLMDSDIYDKSASKPADFTLVFAADMVIKDTTYTRCWNIDLQTYADNTIATILKARVNDDPFSPSNNPDHVFFYARFNGSSWTSTYLGKAGLKLYGSEQDYTGLGALHPNDPNTIYISTPFDPRDDTDLEVHEIFKGVTDDQGATWSWTPITQNSVRDNLRPIVPEWNEENTALLWWRGTYYTAQIFDAAVVGIIERESESVSPMSYLDATLTNTSLSTGAPLVTTGPDGDRGPTDNQWHRRTGFGNGDTVLTSAEIGGENAPTLKTQVTIPESGIYDIWVNFWANPDYDWRIKAGLSENSMQIFRQMASKQVENGDHQSTLILSGASNTFLYQAYLGRVQALVNDTIDVFVDDEAIETGTVGNLIGDVARTWYDGVSYAILNKTPAFSLSGTAISFGTVEPGSTKQDSVLVFNHGTDTLRVTSILSTNQHFTYAPTSMTLAPWGSSYLVVTFAPQDTSEQTGSIILTHNALGSPDTVTVSGKGGSMVSIKGGKTQIPITYAINQNYPNPFNPTTTITYSLPKNVKVNLKVYNLLGQEVATLINEEMPVGTHSITWNAQNVPSGVYFYKITAGEFSKINKMILLK